MLYYTAKFTIVFKNTIAAHQVNEIISSSINMAMFRDEGLKNLHEKNTFKGYTFSSPYPIETEKIYKPQTLYLLELRSINLNFLLKMKTLLPMSTSYFKVLSCEVNNCKQQYVDKLVTITPAITTLNGSYWVKEDGLEVVMDRMHNNAVRKVKILLNDTFPEPSENFIQCISQLNRKAIKIPYKNTSLIGNKFEIVVKSDAVSQKLAWVVLGCGLAEKGSQGCGFCIAK